QKKTKLKKEEEQNKKMLSQQTPISTKRMEGRRGVLREWFERVDSEKTGNITATQLQVQPAFSDLERGRGYLTADDVHEGLVKIGFSLDSPAYYTVCESFDQKKDGTFRLDDFISLCIFVQSAQNLFNSFDTARQGRITLDLNQFLPIVEYDINKEAIAFPLFTGPNPMYSIRSC
ncbi:hypothetical protein Tsubulata_020738, partial [Turnera subulata]